MRSLNKKVEHPSSFRIKTQSSSKDLSMASMKGKHQDEQNGSSHLYDKALYHKSKNYLKPLRNNPELFTIAEPQSIAKRMRRVDEKVSLELLGSKNKNVSFNKMQVQNETVLQANKSGVNWLNRLKKSQSQLMKGGLNSTLRPNSYVLPPQTMSVRDKLRKVVGEGKNLEKILSEETKMLVTAKKWVIFDMETGISLKGYKSKKEHDIASLTKILTFYTAYHIIQDYFLSLPKFEMYVDEFDEKMQGTRIKELQSETLVTLEDMLYALMLPSANNAATVIATNLGSLVKKKKEGKYFSCFDIPSEDKSENMAIFLGLMNKHAKQLKMESSTFVNVHGVCMNRSTAQDIAKLISECYKIPLFGKVTLSKYHTVKIKDVGEDGEMRFKEVPMKNTNRLLWHKTGCIGGKTGSNQKGGESLAACYEGNVIVVVLGCAGREQKFADAQKLIGWLYTKIQTLESGEQ